MSLCAPARRAPLLSYLWSPIIEQLRFRNRPNLQHPLPEHYARARMLRVCEPQYPPPLRICKKKEEDTEYISPIEENPYGVFLAKDMRKLFYSHPMVAIYHTNWFNMHETIRIQGLFFDNELPITLKCHQNHKVSTLALTGTRFEPALRLMTCHVGLLYCESTDIRKLLDLSKKMPYWLLVGVILHDRLMHKADFEKYAKTDIDTVRGQFCNTLSLASGGDLSRNLVANINALSHSLTTYSSSSKDAVNNGSNNNDDAGSEAVTTAQPET